MTDTSDKAARAGWTPKKSIDPISRRAKARKVVALIRRWTELEGKRVLDVGTGGGANATIMAEAVGPSGEVHGVDVEDLRIVEEGYTFQLVSGTKLPFEDGYFDVAVSSHVIEHVGTRADQRSHLEELRRVLTHDGNLYLATPNRWSVIEPHFKLPLLSWLPRPLRTPYLKVTRRGRIYDVDPLGPRELPRMMAETGFDAVDQTYDAMQAMLETESPTGPKGWVLRAPKPIVSLARPLSPTFLYRGIAHR
jgi:SAM-dependent methyltransferase